VDGCIGGAEREMYSKQLETMKNEEEEEIGIKLKERRINKQKVGTEMKWRRNRMKADAGKNDEGCLI
jgi:hypothetical protein